MWWRPFDQLSEFLRHVKVFIISLGRLRNLLVALHWLNKHVGVFGGICRLNSIPDVVSVLLGVSPGSKEAFRCIWFEFNAFCQIFIHWRIRFKNGCRGCKLFLRSRWSVRRLFKHLAVLTLHWCLQSKLPSRKWALQIWILPLAFIYLLFERWLIRLIRVLVLPLSPDRCDSVNSTGVFGEI